MKKEVVENKTAKNEAIKVTELKASMLDNITKTYMDVDDNETMMDIVFNQISTYAELLASIGALKRG